jgi:S1-C subfamily serine protease
MAFEVKQFARQNMTGASDCCLTVFPHPIYNKAVNSFTRKLLGDIFSLIKLFRQMFTMTRVVELTGVLIIISFFLPSCNIIHPITSTTSEPNGLPTSEESVPLISPIDFAKLYQDVQPSVVSVMSDTLNGVDIGTGFILDEEGHIVTSYHVVQTESDIKVKFSSGEIAPASLLGKDEESDLAVLKLEATVGELVPLNLGISDHVKTGQSVAAIGNPFGLEGTMTTGIISGANQDLRYFKEMLGSGGDFLGEIIVFDAPINPGNSGGPLINTSGEVIGIIRNVITATGKNQPAGVAFAMPIDIAKPIINSLVERGYYLHPDLGLSGVDQFTLEEVESLGLPVPDGVYITEVEAGGPAEDAGLVAGYNESGILEVPPGGDIILAVDNTELENYDQLIAYVIKNKQPGDIIQLTVLREDEEYVLPLVIGIAENNSSDDW